MNHVSWVSFASVFAFVPLLMLPRVRSSVLVPHESACLKSFPQLSVANSSQLSEPQYVAQAYKNGPSKAQQKLLFRRHLLASSNDRCFYPTCFTMHQLSRGISTRNAYSVQLWRNHTQLKAAMSHYKQPSSVCHWHSMAFPHHHIHRVWMTRQNQMPTSCESPLYATYWMWPAESEGWACIPLCWKKLIILTTKMHWMEKQKNTNCMNIKLEDSTLRFGSHSSV